MKVFLVSTMLAALVSRTVADMSICGGSECDPVEGEVYDGNGGRALNHNTIPPGGWTAHSTVACGLEWMWAGPVYPGDAYYNVNPGASEPQGCPFSWSTSNRFPDCVEHSGFRLPTRMEVDYCFPIATPPCLSTYADSLFNVCNEVNYINNVPYNTFELGFPLVAVQDDEEVCYAETVYVRPVGSRDSCVEGGGGFGDPHFKMWKGAKFDFHGACDLVLLTNPDFGNGVGMDIYLRTKFTNQWSYIDSAVVRIGKDTLEVAGTDGEEGSSPRYWRNKIFNDDLSKGLSGFGIEYKWLNSKQSEFVVNVGNGESIRLKTWKRFVRVDVQAGREENFGRSLGLMGGYSNGLKLGRDGETIIEDNNEFGMEWQVLASEDMLFHTVEGIQAPERCPLPDVSRRLRRRLGESLISSEDAALACSRVDAEYRDACMFDVLATNDKEIAGAY